VVGVKLARLVVDGPVGQLLVRVVGEVQRRQQLLPEVPASRQIRHAPDAQTPRQRHRGLLRQLQHLFFLVTHLLEMNISV